MYHVNPDSGNPGLCKAVYKCPFGESTEHYQTPEEGRAAYEEQMAENTFVAREYESEPEDPLASVVPDEELVEDCEHFYFKYGEVEFTRDWDKFSAAVYRGSLENDQPALEIWHHRGASIDGWLTSSLDHERLVTVTPLPEHLDADGDLTAHAKAAFTTTLMDAAKDVQPETYDSSHPAYEKRVELEEEMKTGSVTLNGVELRNTYSHAPQIWESHEVDIPGVSEVYMRQRHGKAALRVRQEDGEVISIYSENVIDGNWTDKQMAKFFTKAHEELVRYEALRS